jgi:shikimate dehydrogenase
VTSDAVRRTGACNCFWGLPGGKLTGDNTDVAAFTDAVESLSDVRLEGARLLLLGAGGGARAVLLAGLERGVERIDILNRSPERAVAAAAHVIGDRLPVRVLEQTPASGHYDLVVNATSLGLRSTDPLPIDLGPLDAAAAFDLVYGEQGTRWTAHATALGVTATDGLDMLVRQAGYSIRRWLDVDPPLDVMRRAADRALSDRRA